MKTASCGEAAQSQRRISQLYPIVVFSRMCHSIDEKGRHGWRWPSEVPSPTRTLQFPGSHWAGRIRTCLKSSKFSVGSQLPWFRACHMIKRWSEDLRPCNLQPAGCRCCQCWEVFFPCMLLISCAPRNIRRIVSQRFSLPFSLFPINHGRNECSAHYLRTTALLRSLVSAGT
jgi:hypothetical protein